MYHYILTGTIACFFVAELIQSPILWLVADLLVLWELLRGGRNKKSVQIEAPRVASARMEGKRLLGEILPITNRIQTEEELIRSLNTVIVENLEAFNLIHISTIVRKLSQAKLPLTAVDGVLVSKFESLIISVDSKFLKTAVHGVITFSKSGIVLDSIDAFIQQHVSQMDIGMVTQLLTVRSENSDLLDRLLEGTDSLSQIDLATLVVTKPLSHIDINPLISRCDKFSSNGLALIIRGCNNHSESLKHIKPRLEIDPSCPLSDLVAAFRLTHSEECVPRIVEDFFRLQCNANMFLDIAVSNELAATLAEGLAQHVVTSGNPIDWERVGVAIHLLSPFDGTIPFDEISRKLGKGESDAVKYIESVLVERFDKSMCEEIKPFKSRVSVIDSIFVLGNRQASLKLKRKARACLRQATGSIVAGSVAVATNVCEHADEAIVEFVQPQLKFCSANMLCALICKMATNPALVHELAYRLEMDQLPFDRIIDIINQYCACNVSPTLLDPFFICLKQWLVPRIPKLDLNAINRITECLEKFGSVFGETESTSSDTGITTP